MTISAARLEAPRTGALRGSAGARRFALELGRWRENELPRALLAAQRRFVMEAMTRIFPRSPVKTGRFRGHWVVSVGVRSSELTGIRFRGHFGSPMSPAERSRVEAAIANMRTGERVFIVNNLPYAQRLEEGWSGMAPHGVLALTFAELRRLRLKEA